jgi:hypothetical protein
MKAFPPIALVFALALTAHADVVIEQEVESPAGKGKIVMKIKGDRARIESPTSSGNTVTVMNMKTGELATMLPADKVVVKADLKTVKAQQEAMFKRLGLDLTKEQKPTPTGTTEKVGEYTADVYDFSFGELTGKIWAAKDFPNAQLFKDEMKRVGEAGTMGLNLARLEVPGMLVKSRMATPAGTMTLTVVSARQEPVPEADFAIPADYQEVKVPAGGNPPPK